MSLKRKFQEELKILHEQADEFVLENPKLAAYLGGKSNDPDIERLTQTFAFLVAKLRLKIDDDFPELTQSMLELLWPNYLRPIPSMTIVRFDPVERAIMRGHVKKRGTVVMSRTIEGVSCPFRTCADVPVYPLGIEAVSDEHSRERSIIRVTLRSLMSAPLRGMSCERLRFHLSGDDTTALTIYLWLAQYLKSVRFIAGGETLNLGADVIGFPGFGPDEALLPNPQDAGDSYRILQEYFLFPRRFYFFELLRLSGCWPTQPVDDVVLEFHFSRPMPAGTRIALEDLALHCVPAVNLFECHAQPVAPTGEDDSYPLRPRGSDKHIDIFSVDTVSAGDTQGNGVREYPRYESFGHEVERAGARTARYYNVQIRERVNGSGVTHAIGFVHGDESSHGTDRDTVSVSMTCTNGDLPAGLAVGDISDHEVESEAFATATNVTVPTRCWPPVLDESVHWALISNLSLNYLSLTRAESLREVLRVYDFPSSYDLQQERMTRQRLDGILDAQTSPTDLIIRRAVVRGLETVLTIDPMQFLCEGDLYLFGTALSHFLALYASINSFHQLDVVNSVNHERYIWPARPGTQPQI
jgi:type VI secretion system protein ImpG